MQGGEEVVRGGGAVVLLGVEPARGEARVPGEDDLALGRGPRGGRPRRQRRDAAAIRIRATASRRDIMPGLHSRRRGRTAADRAVGSPEPRGAVDGGEPRIGVVGRATRGATSAILRHNPGSVKTPPGPAPGDGSEVDLRAHLEYPLGRDPVEVTRPGRRCATCTTNSRLRQSAIPGSAVGTRVSRPRKYVVSSRRAPRPAALQPPRGSPGRSASP